MFDKTVSESYAFTNLMGERAEKKVYSDSAAPFLLSDLVKEAVQADAQKWPKERFQQSEAAKEILRRIFGSDVEFPTYLSPSISSRCLRWAAYDTLPTPEPLPSTFEQNMNMTVGTSVHWALLKKLSPFGLPELSFRTDEPFISGRLDFLFRNPQTKKWQVLDFKVVGDYMFTAIKRDGLPRHLKENKNVYKAKPEAELQTLLYMWVAKNQGYDVSAGNVIYINKRDNDIKECLILWDAVGEEKVKNFLDLLREAQQLIKDNKLPEPSVVRGNEVLCRSICSYRHVCEPGKEIAGGIVEIPKKKRLSRQARYFAKIRSKEKEEEMKKMGHLQPNLFEGEKVKFDK